MHHDRGSDGPPPTRSQPADTAPEPFDALTDLFIGEPTRIPGCERSSVVGPADATAPTDQQTRIAKIASALSGESISLPAMSASLRANDPPAPAQPVAPSEPAQPDKAPPLVELVLTGHLPMMGPAWTSQYVRNVSQRRRCPVLSIRLGSGHARLDLVDHGKSLTGVEPISDLPTALGAALRVCGHVLIVTEPGLDEPPVPTRRCARVTLLTCADEAGVVSAYRVLKQLGAATTKSPGVEPTVRVALMGCPPVKADGVWRRLGEAAHSFLGLHVEPGTCIERLDAGTPAATLFDGPFPAGVPALLELIEALEHAHAPSDEPEAQPFTPPVPAPAPSKSPEPVRPLLPLDEPAAKVTPRGVKPAPGPSEFLASPGRIPATALEAIELASAAARQLLAVNEPTIAQHDAIAQAARSPGVPPAARPAPSPAPTPTSTPVLAPIPQGVPVSAQAPARAYTTPSLPEPDLSALLDLHPMVARCPFDEPVQLAIDESGRLCALLRDEGDPSTACARLVAAGAWAKENARVLALTLGGTRTLDPALPLSLHLFTATPDKARRLLDSDVKLHAMAPATAARSNGWLSLALN